jgi:hypothetical protein
MSVPQKEKEGPASMLRAMFAGVGSLLSVLDKVRGKSAAQAPAGTAPPAPAAPETVAPETVVPETAAPETAAPETTAPETAAPETVVAETVVAETGAPEVSAAPATVAAETSAASETVTPQASVAPEPTGTPEAAAELPLANYDESTVASLRARLRNLSVEQLTQLLEYEKGHAARADVITMFERRIAKVETGA